MTEFRFTVEQEKWLHYAREGEHASLAYALASAGMGSGRSRFLKELAKAYDARPGADGRYFYRAEARDLP